MGVPQVLSGSLHAAGKGTSPRAEAENSEDEAAQGEDPVAGHFEEEVFLSLVLLLVGHPSPGRSVGDSVLRRHLC